MNSVPLNSVEANSVLLNTICLNSVGVPSKRDTIYVPEPEADFDFKLLPSGVNTLTDRTGKHTLTLNNFAHDGMSGKDGYAVNFKNYIAFNPNATTKTGKKVNIKKIGNGSYIIYRDNYHQYISIIEPSYKIKVSGIPIGKTLTYTYGIKGSKNVGNYSMTTDGEYVLPENNFIREQTDPYQHVGFTMREMNMSDCDITIEQLPLYPDALLFDGKDDNAVVDASIVNTLIKTMIMDWIPFYSNGIAYDQRESGNNFALFTNQLDSEGLAYSGRFSGITYINGELNKTFYPSNLLSKRHTVSMVKKDVTNMISSIIGCSRAKTNYQSGAFYRIQLYKEALTDIQQKKAIEKYKLTKYDKL